jgi:flagellar protein FlaI
MRRKQRKKIIKKKTKKKIKTKVKGETKRLRTIESYSLKVDGVPVRMSIVEDPKQFTMLYKVFVPQLKVGTAAALESVRDKLVSEIQLTPEELVNVKSTLKVKQKFKDKIASLLQRKFPSRSKESIDTLTGYLLHESFGFGPIEFLLDDPNLEEIIVHGKTSLIWVYHKKYGWLRSSIKLESGKTRNYSSKIARQAGRQISNLDPLLDAHLLTGDRVNAVLFPISSFGDILTIRKFRRSPWSIVDLIKNSTLNREIAAFIWLMIQSEMSIIFSGGTASGKTTLLNACMSFIPANHRIVSIEETREILLPEFLHWEPLHTREKNPEGKGEITMLDLLINSLRMRPDRIVVGEIRRKAEAETLFEAIHTGHSVYATVHADTADQTLRRLSNPPIDLPETMLETLPIVVVVFRHRRKRIRRVLEVAEVIPKKSGEHISANDMWKWDIRTDSFLENRKWKRMKDDIKLHTGMTDAEIRRDMEEKKKILDWMMKNDIRDVNNVGRVINIYYNNRKKLLEFIRKKYNKDKILRGGAL